MANEIQPGVQPSDTFLDRYRQLNSDPTADFNTMTAVAFDTSGTLLGTYTVATLPAPSASNFGRVVAVTDLFGDTGDRVRCIKRGAIYYWKPLTPSSTVTQAVSGDLTFTPLGHPETIVLTGTIGVGVTRTMTLDPAGGWPGAKKRFRAAFTSLLGTLNVAGTGIGSAISLALGTTKDFELIDNGGTLNWVQTA